MRETQKDWTDTNHLPPRYAALLPVPYRGNGNTQIHDLNREERDAMRKLKADMPAFRERTIREAAARMRK